MKEVDHSFLENTSDAWFQVKPILKVVYCFGDIKKTPKNIAIRRQHLSKGGGGSAGCGQRPHFDIFFGTIPLRQSSSS